MQATAHPPVYIHEQKRRLRNPYVFQNRAFSTSSSTRPRTPMGPPSPFRSSVFVLSILLLVFSSVSCSLVSGQEASLVVGETSKLEISPSLKLVNSPGTKPGTSVLCERVHIRGLSRLRNLKKFSHSVKLILSHSSSGLLRSNVEVCFHRNASLAIGMCPQGRWQKVDKGLWASAMSPFDHKLLDIRMRSSSSEKLELSIEEEFFFYRVIFLVLGIILLSVASSWSKSLAFYYSSAMAIGIILVILVVLFQGMKLLPTGRKNSLAIFIYSSLVGLGSFLLRYVPGLLHSILMEMGINEDMYYPLAVFLLAFIVLAGAWMGFWAVRKLVLAEDGSVDISTSYFVAWSIRIVAVIAILQSSLDPLLAAEALIAGIVISSTLRRIFRWRFVRRSCKKLFKFVKSIQWESPIPDISPIRDSYDEYTLESPKDSWRQPKRCAQNSYSSPVKGFRRTTPDRLSDSDIFLSTFHSTPERKKIPKETWEKFTKETTQKAVQELVASPDFSRWVSANAERITVTPTSSNASVQQRRKWFFWS